MFNDTVHSSHRGWGMKVAGFMIKIGMIFTIVLNASIAWAELPQHVTEQFGAVLDSEIEDVEGNWVEVSPESRVQINTVTQEVTFNIVGLSGKDQALVKGILICQASGDARRVDTPGVPINSEGVASFSGTVKLPQACVTSPSDIAFFVRTFAHSDNAFVAWN